MNFTNTVINSYGSSAAKDALSGGPKVTNMGTMNATNDSDQLVKLTHRTVTGETNIFANTPPNFNLEISAEWNPRTGMPTLSDVAETAVGSNWGSAAKKVLDASGLGGATMKYQTASYWEGCSPIQCTIPFEFVVEDDADMQVIKPLVYLYRMAAPYEIGGALIPPGPSVLGTALGGEQVTIRIGNILTFKNVVIIGVNGEIDTRLSQDGKIMHAKVEVTFKSFFTVSRDDISEIFGMPPGDGTNASGNE